ncbi:HupE/UreJ family protein [Phenylobacterium sp. VNQ135]|uniref:HupE/UreJ family protein n=1 Tax=Phenylobacterium sp. VNQ135 TaxID=3400922 RepID=UPI003C03A525
MFGLLHGLGFASALAEIGLPQHEVPLALLAFNLGVEAGQIAFIAALLGGGVAGPGSRPRQAAGGVYGFRLRGGFAGRVLDARARARLLTARLAATRAALGRSGLGGGVVVPDREHA